MTAHRSPQLQLTTGDARVLARALGLSAAAIVLPGRAGRLAGLTLGVYLLRRQALNVESTDRQAREAAERGGQRYALLDARVADLEDLLAAAEPDGLPIADEDVAAARRRVVHQAVHRCDPFTRARQNARR